MNCPLCGRPKPANVHFVCPKCWPRIPSDDRQKLGALLRQGGIKATESKLAAVVRKMKGGL
jgi:hypothetical protein